MRALPEHERTDNTNADLRERNRCGPCHDSGWVEAATRVDTYNGISAVVEEYAPCPFCKRGLGFEFPEPKWIEKPESTKPPWGTDGYWQGRELPEHLVSLAIPAGRPQPPLSMAQQRAALAALVGSVSFNSIDTKIEPRPRQPLVTNETAFPPPAVAPGSEEPPWPTEPPIREQTEPKEAA